MVAHRPYRDHLCPAGKELKQFIEPMRHPDRGSRPMGHGFTVLERRTVIAAN